MSDERLRKDLVEGIKRLQEQPDVTPIGSNEQFEEAVDRNAQKGTTSVAIFGPDGVTVQQLPAELRDALAKLREELEKRSKGQSN